MAGTSGSRVGTVASTLALTAILVAGVVTWAVAEDRSAGPARTKLSIQAWPEGLFGLVKSARESCANGRRVAVYEQRGKRPRPREDTRFAVTTAQRSGGGVAQWFVRTGRVGAFYAKARGTPGCVADLTGAIKVAQPGSGVTGTGGAPEPPLCSPWVSDTDATVCRLDQVHAKLNCYSFTRPSGNCPGEGESGPFPWGQRPDGGPPEVTFYWNHTTHEVTFVSYPERSRTGMAHLGGTLPSASSAAFHINDGFAQNELGYPHGDHFYTPDLPGQAPGEVGGPLYLDYKSNNLKDDDLYIRGYLYLKT